MTNPMDRQVALAMLAHPDDAEFLCAGTLVRLAAAGWEVHIATATPGDCGTISETPRAISARRTAEARQAAALIGARYHCLDERDGMVVYDKPTLRKAIDLFRRVAPTLVLTHAPKDYMMDHEMTSLVARAASFAYAAPNISTLPLCPGSRVPYLYYCDPTEGTDPLGAVVQPSTWVDIAAQLERKAEMLACHASQREWLMAHHGIDEYVASMKRHAAWRGREAGTMAAEAFVQHRGHAYPKDDLLARLFGPTLTV
ncbi:MAG: PIG-L family deacetylase [Thermoguttaceae bacterium]|jgi:LmbE family N-acetylglucosaminyl deacetylase